MSLRESSSIASGETLGDFGAFEPGAPSEATPPPQAAQPHPFGEQLVALAKAEEMPEGAKIPTKLRSVVGPDQTAFLPTADMRDVLDRVQTERGASILANMGVVARLTVIQPISDEAGGPPKLQQLGTLYIGNGRRTPTPTAIAGLVQHPGLQDHTVKDLAQELQGRDLLHVGEPTHFAAQPEGYGIALISPELPDDISEEEAAGCVQVVGITCEPAERKLSVSFSDNPDDQEAIQSGKKIVVGWLSQGAHGTLLASGPRTVGQIATLPETHMLFETDNSLIPVQLHPTQAPGVQEELTAFVSRHEEPATLKPSGNTEEPQSLAAEQPAREAEAPMGPILRLGGRATDDDRPNGFRELDENAFIPVGRLQRVRRRGGSRV